MTQRSPNVNADQSRRYKSMVLGLLLMGLAVRLAIAWLPFEYQVKRGSLVDDAFYSLNVSRHLAQGHGPTFDGVNRTNGFQPLYVFMMVPAYWIWPDNRTAPVYAALTILALAGMATGYFVFRIAKRHWGPRSRDCSRSPCFAFLLTSSTTP